VREETDRLINWGGQWGVENRCGGSKSARTKIIG
jgi:hypothetical protein